MAGRKKSPDDPRPAPGPPSLLAAEDFHLFNEGSHFTLYEKLGAHAAKPGPGTRFAVWAPNAERVSVVGDFNGWEESAHPLRPQGTSGIWAEEVREAGPGSRYKYRIRSRHGGYRVDKADPFGFRHEIPPRTASVVWSLDYEWGDREWMRNRGERQSLARPVSVYEVHLGSWRRVPEEGNRELGYREIAPRLVEHAKRLGVTHVEFLPVMEHPFRGSWGYQSTGYFAPTSRHGDPQDFMHLIDTLHRHDIGVFLDWVPSHFPSDEHGLGFFDGTHLFEHADPRQGFHPEWKSAIFNYGRHEVRSFLISSALFWLDRYHADGLRVDGVASMLYLDYGRAAGEWIPNEHGGRENLAAVGLLRRLNEEAYRRHPDIQVIAEESTSWPMVTRPTSVGGLGFGLKWDMGWMHDTLIHFSRDPVHRKYHHHETTFRLLYAFSENFMLPLSHDEVVHGKGSLLRRMPGDAWRKFANLRLLLAWQFAQPGKKLLFMGGEFGQWDEWYHESSLDWHLLDDPAHAGILALAGDLNRLYRSEPALHEKDCDPGGFEWVDCSDSEGGVLAFLRKGIAPRALLMAVFNFTPVVRTGYRIGAPTGGAWREILNTDGREYGGGGIGNAGGSRALDEPWHGRPRSLALTIPPLGALFLKPGEES